MFSITTLLNYRKEIFLFMIIITTSAYITYLNFNIHSLESNYKNLNENIIQERIEAQARAREEEIKYKELENKYSIEVLKKKLVIKETIKTEIKYIKGDDVNHTLIMDGNCSDYMKGRYNETNVINRII